MSGLEMQRFRTLHDDAWKAFDATGVIVACGALNEPTVEIGDPRPVTKIVCGVDAYAALRQVFEEEAASW